MAEKIDAHLKAFYQFMYVLRCADGSLYAGYAVDVAARVAAHNAGRGGKCTRARRPVELVACARFFTKQQAMRAEWAFKQLSRAEKLRVLECAEAAGVRACADAVGEDAALVVAGVGADADTQKIDAKHAEDPDKVAEILCKNKESDTSEYESAQSLAGDDGKSGQQATSQLFAAAGGGARGDGGASAREEAVIARAEAFREVLRREVPAMAAEPAAEWLARQLFAARDEAYRAFQSPLMPSVNPARVVGVRTPQLRQLARQLAARPDAETWLEALPHATFEELQVHAFALPHLARRGAWDWERTRAAYQALVAHINNWATADQLPRGPLIQWPENARDLALQWVRSGRPYEVRAGIVVLMREFLGERFEPSQMAAVAAVDAAAMWPGGPGTTRAKVAKGRPAACGNTVAGGASAVEDAHATRVSAAETGKARLGCGLDASTQAADNQTDASLSNAPVATTKAAPGACGPSPLDSAAVLAGAASAEEFACRAPHAGYYVNMARAWYFAEALAAQPDAALPYLQADAGLLDEFTRKLALRKARESRKVPREVIPKQ